MKHIKRIEVRVPELRDDAVYYTNDFAAFFRKSSLTIRRWVRAGKIPAPSEKSGGWRGSAVRQILDQMAPPADE